MTIPECQPIPSLTLKSPGRLVLVVPIEVESTKLPDYGLLFVSANVFSQRCGDSFPLSFVAARPPSFFNQVIVKSKIRRHDV